MVPQAARRDGPIVRYGLFVLAAAAGCAPAAAQPSSCERNVRQVQQLEHAWLDAYERHDPESMAAILAPGFTITYPNAMVETREEVIANMRRKRGQRGNRFSTDGVAGRCHGLAVVLVGWVSSEGGARERYTDTYVRHGGKWAVAASHLSAPREKDGTAFAAAQAELKAFPPPGAAMALVARDRADFSQFGVERLPGGAPVSPKTIFQIASLTKPFTAIVVLRLAEQKRLGLDDRAAKWLDWLPDKYHGVTIRQLLNHTSGVPRDLRRENVDEFTIEEFRRRFLAAEPSFPGGTRWEYSNSGYILLSLIAERAGGENFGAVLDRHIFAPLAMRDSRYRAPLVQARGRASGYDWQDGAWKGAPQVYSGFGNSGIETTAADLALFAQALHDRRLLSAASYREMLAPALLGSGQPVEFPFREWKKSSYGLGWFLIDMCGQPVAAHGGTIAGFSSNLSWAHQRKVSAIVLSNGKARPDRTGVSDKVATALLRSALGCAG